MEKECSKCKSITDLTDFHKNKNSKDGHSSICKTCANKSAKEYAAKNLERLITNKKLRRTDVRKRLLESAQNRARSRNIEINISIEDIIVPEFCPALGIKLEVSPNRASPNSPSLDRIVPELGYIKGNIQVISNKANTTIS